MAKNLVIVESPAKAKTITGYLGPDFQVLSSFGHIRDLPKKGMSIDIENNFEPTYEISTDKKKTIAELRKAAKAAETVWLASDEDREGEAIAWHLAEALKLKPANTKRIVFHEITKSAITDAVKNPRKLDVNLVDAQQARRVLDRLVGYELSPVLWKKIRAGLSAGRVQSVSVRLVVEKEREIEGYESETTYKVKAIFATDESDLETELATDLPDLATAQKLLQEFAGASFKVDDLEKKPGVKNPGGPFTTSTLQQTASSMLGFSPKATMQLAQRLYEAGKITYMRTDSVNLSGQALAQATEVITNKFGKEYHQFRTFKTKSKGAQEAHEAIRPTDLSTFEAGADERQAKLYTLIHSRTLASQMAPAKTERTTVSITNDKNDSVFKGKGEIVTFEGFLKVQPKRADDTLLPALKVGQQLDPNEITARESFSRPPARYTEASLIKKLEELGIGRPSTFAPTISTIQAREYVMKGESEGKPRDVTVVTMKSESVSTESESENTGSNRGKLVPTDTGRVVTDFLVKHFPRVIDYDFTKTVEASFDEIADGEKQWQKVIADFYKPFHKDVEDAADIDRQEANKARELGKHPKTGKPIVARLARFGPVVQHGDKEKDEKLQFAPLPPDTTLETVTLEQALKQFELPRIVGKTEEGETIEANIGRFGPYVKVGKIYANMGEEDPHKITLETARQLIADKKAGKASNTIKEFESDDIQILKGRFGPYVKQGKINATIPKAEKPEDVTLERAKELIEKKKAAPPRANKSFSKKKPAAKKKTAKKK